MQRDLLDRGFRLDVHGPDGKHGDETDAAFEALLDEYDHLKTAVDLTSHRISIPSILTLIGGLAIAITGYLWLSTNVG